MRRTVSLLCLVLTSATVALGQQALPDVGGTWSLTSKTFMATIQITQNGSSLSGQFTFSDYPCVRSAELTFTGSISSQNGGNRVSMKLDQFGPSFSGVVNPDSMAGTSTVPYYIYGLGCVFGPEQNWMAERVAPAPSVTSVTNAASSASTAIAGAEIVTIKGTGLGPSTGVSFTGNLARTLAGVTVLFGSVAAPVTYASASQVNAIVPYETFGSGTMSVMKVQYQGVSSADKTLVVASAAPGVFTLNGSGTGQALAVNQDGSLNGPLNPAARGSYVTSYFTGGGQTLPAGVTGSVSGSVLKWFTQSVSVSVGGQPAMVTFSGAAPGLVDGVGQLNVILDDNTPPGPAQP
jgi:uncharacterized protein (TIGR03437 family)